MLADLRPPSFRYLAGDIKASLSTLQHVVDNLDPTLAEAHLLMAQIQLHQGNYLNAQQTLEVGLSYNFEVRDHPLYHLINAKVLKGQGDVEEAVDTLQVAMSLVGAHEDDSSGSKGKRGRGGSAGNSKKIPFTRTDKVKQKYF